MNVIKPELKIQLELKEVIKARNSRSFPHLEKGYKMGANINITEDEVCLIKSQIPITLLSNNVKGQLY